MSNIPNINNEITKSPVRLIAEDGGMLGVMPLSLAQDKAKQAGLDLVEIVPQSSPAVCKIMDYGKFRYEAQRKKKEAKKKQKITQLKEIKLRVNIGDHDYRVKLNHMKKFIENKDKVKVSIRFRGREITHDNLGKDLMVRVAEDMKEVAKVEQESKMEGRQMTMTLAPA